MRSFPRPGGTLGLFFVTVDICVHYGVHALSEFQLQGCRVLRLGLGQGRGGGVFGYALGVSFASRRLVIPCEISRAIAFAAFAAICYASLALKSANQGCMAVILVDGDPRTSPTPGSPGVRNAPRRSRSISILNSK